LILCNEDVHPSRLRKSRCCYRRSRCTMSTSCDYHRDRGSLYHYSGSYPSTFLFPSSFLPRRYPRGCPTETKLIQNSPQTDQDRDQDRDRLRRRIINWCHQLSRSAQCRRRSSSSSSSSNNYSRGNRQHRHRATDLRKHSYRSTIWKRHWECSYSLLFNRDGVLKRFPVWMDHKSFWFSEKHSHYKSRHFGSLHHTSCSQYYNWNKSDYDLLEPHVDYEQHFGYEQYIHCACHIFAFDG
jgi:hypothetical protein